MATYTSNYAWTKPGGNDQVDISVLNGNLDSQDAIMHKAFTNMAPPFSGLSTYAVGDVVLYDNVTYKCHTAVTVAGAWTGSTNWQVYKLSEGGGGGLTLGETSSTAYRGDRGKAAYDHSQTTGNPHGTTKSDVGLGNVPNVSTNDQTPTFTEAITRNNIASGEKLSVILGKIQKFFNDLKSVAFSGSYADLSNKPQINSVELSGNKTTSELGIDKTAVGLGNVPNVSTNDQTPTFTEASTRNNIASGEKLSVILGKIQKFFNDLKSVAFSGSYTDLTNKPSINGNTLSGNKTTSDLGINATNVMLSDGVTSVEDALGWIEKFEYKVITGTTDAKGFLTTGLQARHYIFMGTLSSTSLFITSLNAMSDGTVRLRFTDGSGNPYANDTINIGCIFAKVS